jgi:hypothetical protein
MVEIFFIASLWYALLSLVVSARFDSTLFNGADFTQSYGKSTFDELLFDSGNCGLFCVADDR